VWLEECDIEKIESYGSSMTTGVFLKDQLLLSHT
jgi:hypothetical protein